MPSLAYRLRLFWYRLDKEAGVAALVFGLILGGLGFVTHSVYAARQESLRKLGEFHAQNITCLARNIYHEARGEPLEGQYAVAEVTMNRKARTPSSTVCSVVLPAPFGPSSAKISPRRTSRSTLSRARRPEA